MHTLVATFVSHFGALRFEKQCAQAGWASRLMPVPRALSSSCGTCVRYEAPEDVLFPEDVHLDELEQVAREDGAEGSSYTTLWEHDSS